MATTAARPALLAAVRDQLEEQRSSPPGSRRRVHANAAPIVAAVDRSDAGSAAAAAAARLANELEAPLVFVFVRRGPSGLFGGPAYQRRLENELATARRALDRAHAAARREGIIADEEVLEGRPARRVLELAKHRGARMIVVGSRRRRLGPSVSRAVIRAADRPVVVAN
jgi:nucleotide-binding universal stress UspA family protein